MRNPFIVGQMIYLRGLEETDLQGPYFQWFNDAEVCRYNGHALFPNSMGRMQEYFSRQATSNSQVVFAIACKASDKHIGNVALQDIDWIARSAEFAIIIGDKDFWGKGVGKEAGELILRYAFQTLNLRRIHCGTHEDNTGMRKLALALGMSEEGRRVKAGFKNDSYFDVIEYGVIRKSS